MVLINNSEDPVKKYLRTADTYHNNALELFGRREFRKAGELLWGAVTQRIKAVAAVRGIQIQNHNEFFNFMREVTREIENPELYQTFLDLNALHKNFYDQIIPETDFQIYIQRVTEFERMIDELLKEIIK